MKYVAWVDRVLNAARRLHAQDPETARYGMQVLQLPAALGFGDVASQPGFTDSADGLFGAIHDALGDLEELGARRDIGPELGIDLGDTARYRAAHREIAAVAGYSGGAHRVNGDGRVGPASDVLCCYCLLGAELAAVSAVAHVSVGW